MKLTNLIVWFYVDLCKHFLVFTFGPNLSLTFPIKTSSTLEKCYITESGRDDLSDFYVKKGFIKTVCLETEQVIGKLRRVDNRIFFELLDQQC